MMKSSSNKLTPFLRFAAAGMLLVWFAAVTACSAECLGEDSHSESAKCDQAAASSSQSHDADKPVSHDDSFCVSLHSLCPQSTSTDLVKPDFGLAFTLDLNSAAQLVVLAQLETSISRQPPDEELVFTLEVSLGAAFYSLAPPVLA